MKTDNEVIAEFMGATVCVTNPKYLVVPNTPQGSLWYPPDLKYNISWDWLVPVVEKIQSLGYVTKSEWNTRIYWFSIWLEDEKTSHCISTQVNETYFKVHYRAVVEFIKWYNEHKN